MLRIDIKEKCCGCEACVQKCPKHCIDFIADIEGFSYPHVNTSLCIDCGLCERVCPVLHPFDELKPLEVYGAINKDMDVRLTSSSGGIFSMLVNNVLRQGGVVFGARFDDSWDVILDESDTEEGCREFKGSKYVQARVGECFKKCEDYIKNGRLVLFSGTPCQVAGLNHYLRKSYDNLITCDFICHGVPSPKVWRRYLREIADKNKGRISHIEFRNKEKGWKKYSLKILMNTDSSELVLSSTFSENSYMKAFLQDLILRPSCYACQAKCGRSNSDITLADFWGVWTLDKELDDDKGTSLIIVHTKKGKALINNNSIKIKQFNYEDIGMLNPSYRKSVQPHKSRSVFFDNIDSYKSVQELIDEITALSLGQKIRNAFSIRYFKRIIQLMGINQIAWFNRRYF